MPLKDLPEVTPDKLRAHARRIKAKMEELGFKNVRVTGPGLGDYEQPPRPSNEKTVGARVTWAGLRERLSYIHPAFSGARPGPGIYPERRKNAKDKPELPYSGDDWVRLALCIAEGKIPLMDDEDHDWIQLLDDWSSGELWFERTGERLDLASLNYPEGGVARRIGAIETRASRVGKRVTIATIISYAADGGCTMPPHDEPTIPSDIGADYLRRGAAGKPSEVTLDPADPVRSAAHFLAQRYMQPTGLRELWTYSDTPYRYTGTHYAEVEDAGLKAQLYPFLQASFKATKNKVGRSGLSLGGTDLRLERVSVADLGRICRRSRRAMRRLSLGVLRGERDHRLPQRLAARRERGPHIVAAHAAVLQRSTRCRSTTMRKRRVRSSRRSSKRYGRTPSSKIASTHWPR